MHARTTTLPALTLLAFCCQQVWAGGIMLYEIGTDNAGLANAGAAARCSSAAPRSIRSATRCRIPPRWQPRNAGLSG